MRRDDPIDDDTPRARAAPSLTAQIDREAAARAYRKVMSGEQPSASEQAALRRYEKQQEEQRRWQYYESIPQKHWRQMSGRQTKVLQEQAERYGIPFGERVVSLPRVVKALHDFLARNARKLSEEDDDLLHAEGTSPALERYREARAKIARLDRLQRESLLVPRHQVRDGLERIATVLRGCGEQLQREYGPGAIDLLHEALEDAQREIDRLVPEVMPGDGADGSRPDDEPSLPSD